MAHQENSWIGELCRLGSRAPLVDLSEIAAANVTVSQVYEYPCLSPLDYLEYLLVDADDSELIAHEKIVNYTGEVREKREALFAGDPSVVSEGLTRLRAPQGRESRRGSWQVLEGTTKVGCALFADSVTVFVEGKRTEPHLTDSTQWHRHRNQVVRNLDCLRAEPARADKWFVLLVVEEDTKAAGEAGGLDSDTATFQASLPHLSEHEVEEVKSHYLGYTTWQQIQQHFDLEDFPDRVDIRGTKRRSRKCPECTTIGLPLVYGLPPYFPLGVAAERGLLALAGCLIGDDSPTWRCPNCGTEWDGPNPARAIRDAVLKVEGTRPFG